MTTPDQMTDLDIVMWCEDNNIGGYYDRDERAQLLEITKGLMDGATICEIGVEQGKSASIFFLEHWRRKTNGWAGFNIHLVDVVDPIPAYLTPDLLAVLTPHRGFSKDVFREVPDRLDLLHVDGGHEDDVWRDCAFYLPKVLVGGYAVFHDYLRRGTDGKGDVFPAVTRAVDHYLGEGEAGMRWKIVSVVNTQFTAMRIQ